MATSTFTFGAVMASLFGPGLPVGTIPASSYEGGVGRVTLSGGVDLDGATVGASDVGGGALELSTSRPRSRLGMTSEFRLTEGLELVTGFGTPTYMRFSALDEGRSRTPLSLAVGLGMSWVQRPRLAAGVQVSKELPLNHDLSLRPMAALWWQPHQAKVSIEIPEGELSQGTLSLRRERTLAMVVPIGLDLAMKADTRSEVALNLGAAFAVPLREEWQVHCDDCDIIIEELGSRNLPALSIGMRFGPGEGRQPDSKHRQPPAPTHREASAR